jgi:hypothetical protein
VLELGPSQWFLVEVLAKKEPYPYRILSIGGLDLRVFDSRNRKIARHEKRLC